MYIAQQLMKKLFSIVKKLSAERFAELHSDGPKLLFRSQALLRGHKNLKCNLPHIPTVGHRLKVVRFNFTKLGIQLQ